MKDGQRTGRLFLFNEFCSVMDGVDTFSVLHDNVKEEKDSLIKMLAENKRRKIINRASKFQAKFYLYCPLYSTVFTKLDVMVTNFLLLRDYAPVVADNANKDSYNVLNQLLTVFITHNDIRPPHMKYVNLYSKDLIQLFKGAGLSL